MSVLALFSRFSARISIRLLAFNLLLVFLPAAAILYLDTYEEQLLKAQERSMVQQGRILSAALAAGGELTSDGVERVLVNLGRRTTARLRVLDDEGRLLADSSRLGPRRGSGREPPTREIELRERLLYRLGSALYGLFSRLFGLPQTDLSAREHYSSDQVFRGSEVRDALAGRYGAAYRISPGQRSVTLYSAIPVRRGGGVVGVVLVSQSTFRLLEDLYEVRLAIFKVILASLVAAVVLSLLVSTTIARPLRELRREASAILDRRGRLRGRFRGFRRRDEIGDLSRALERLSRRLTEHVGFFETFAADVSHEFKNPLASIRGATEMLVEVEDPEARRRFARMAEREIARLERLLSAVQEISLIDAQLGEEEVAPLALDALLAGMIEGIRLRGDGGVDLELQVAEPGLWVAGAPERLAQVFENILDNALSFSPAGARVQVRVGREEGAAVVRITDRGPGIPEEHLERIFSRFFSYRPDSRDGRSHAGLGLAIVKAIVEGYGGAISAYNEAQGGATFEVRLPVVQ